MNLARARFLIAMVAACSIFVACDDGPTAPSLRTVPTSVPARATLTPLPAPNVAGSWSGTFHPGQSSFCGPVAAASATFSQEGSRVTGSITTTSQGFPSGRFDGEFQGLHLSGTLKIGSTTKLVTGSASATVLTMRFPGLSPFCAQGSIVFIR